MEQYSTNHGTLNDIRKIVLSGFSRFTNQDANSYPELITIFPMDKRSYSLPDYQKLGTNHESSS